jgi:uncharacterized membrane protein YfcA
MQFYLLLLLGFLGGIPAGMGMGGGTVTIPLLIFICGIDQRVAACANLFSFLPMSGLVLRKHAQNKLVKTQGIWWMICPALLTSVIGSWMVGGLNPAFLKKAFGVFLIALALLSIPSKNKG